MKKHRTLKLVLALCVVASMFATTAYALKLDFAFDLMGGTNPSYSAQNRKNDAEQTAYITVASLTSPGITYASVTNTSYVPVTAEKNISGVGSYKINYNSNMYAYEGQPMVLKIWSTQPGRITGRWNS